MQLRSSNLRVWARRTVAPVLGCFLCWCSLGFVLSVPNAAHHLQVQVVPRCNSAPVGFDSLTMTNGAGQSFSITRLDFLLSDFALRRTDDRWVLSQGQQAYLSPREKRSGFEVKGIPAGSYDRIRFHVGLAPELNHSDPAKYPPGHPLHPNLNGLHWGWMGGYVFFALEGRWRTETGKVSGYSYHLATDRQLMSVELPVKLDLSNGGELRLAFNVDQIFGGAGSVALSEATASTHSRTNDSLADALHENIVRAFAVDGSSAVVAQSAPIVATRHVEIAPNAKPYPLSFAAFFPRPALPMDNPLSEEGVELGRQLFFDRQLSVNNSQSCASCHRPTSAFTDSQAVSTGAEGQAGTRNAMTLFNLAWKSTFFWDGRAATLREQVLQPIQNPVEMHETLLNVAAKLKRSANYADGFSRAFGTPEITADRIARAFEQFLLTQVSCDSKFDRVIQGEAKFTDEEQRGFELFHTEYDPRREQFGADCFHCHGGPLFQSQNFANNGLDAEFADLGRQRVTGKDGDQARFSVPSLRNVELTAPYMHDGRFKTLEEAVEHYCTGMKRSSTLDPNLAKHPDGGLPLSGADKKALVAFLRTLTDVKYRQEADLLLSANGKIPTK
jgi:cytochrome c peroxidase